MTRVIIGPLLVPRSPQAKGMSLRLKSFIAAIFASLGLYALLILPLTSCQSRQPPCSDCWIVLRDMEANR